MTRWTPLTHLTAGLLLGAGVLVTGALGGRPDVAALGVAPLLTAVWGWTRRPRDPLEVQVRAPRQLTASAELRAPALLRAPEGAVAARLRSSSPGTEPDECLVRLLPGEVREVALATTSVRTGENQLFRLDAVGLGSGHVTAGEVLTVGPSSVLVLPGQPPLDRLPLPPRLQGLVGPHAARRIGDGEELHDVNLFTAGDRLRRIDWRTSARRGVQDGRLQDLYVRRTQSTAEATVVLVIDSRDDVGPDVATWAGGRAVLTSDVTSLDIAREAAASLARAYLGQGDRVGLEDLGLRRRPVRPGGGRRHLERVVRRLALSAPEGTPRPRVRAPQVPSGALVVVLSTFLDDEAATMALTWRHAGHRVVAVDVLPPVRGAQMSVRLLMAYRMVSLQREDRLTTLRRGGVEVVRWAADGPPPSGGRAQLATLARRRHGAPR
ncbi:DUF58 domain-containing protein [Georgenia satyanarayanai]|uniref:DUF58 domain-containing protein n=1 Tax=Georgenia satyanarayanai TaxID=860221 RepID=UPI00203E518E|nr:DUF58 domain-containing protein [Georgenia satyanarayanai]MCM3662485.1 DUF58 domain-containing protein [Georgenia satyanarayanai]